MNESNIYVFSQPIRSGKTTKLMEWVETQNGVQGILCPDVDGRRKLYDIGTKKYYDLEVGEAGEGSIAIGRFYFDERVFEKGRTILAAALQQQPEWLVIDEVGKLEVEQGKGFEPMVKTVIDQYKTKQQKGKLLIVIRDTLLPQAIEHYGLNDNQVISKEFFG